MENKLLRFVEKNIVSSKDLFKFSKKVGELEFIPEQYKNTFRTKENIEKYMEYWQDLEVLNALALNEWEESGKSEKFGKIWAQKYEDDAKKMLKNLYDFIADLV